MNSNSLIPMWLSICAFSLLTCNVHGQMLSMDFSINATTTIVGPTPNSISASAGSVAGGSSGKGLSAKKTNPDPKADINMTFANTANYWNVNGIDVSIDFQREESEGWFFTRNSNDFRFGMAGGNLQVRYEVDNGAGGSTTINSGNIQGIPNDNTWRTYRFLYDPQTGIGEVTVNGVTVWTNDGPDNRAMYWNGAGNMVIGNMMDASGNQSAIFDGILIDSFSAAPILPVELIEFRAHRNSQDVLLNWITASEMNNDFFELQRSEDAKSWETLINVQGSGTSKQKIEYIEHDYNAPEGELFYRLRQVDYDGKYQYSEVSYVPPKTANSEKTEVIFQTFPNPIEKGNLLNLVFENLEGKDLLLVLRDMNGRELFVKTVYVASTNQYEVIELSATIPAGKYIITATSDDSIYNSKLMVR